MLDLLVHHITSRLNPAKRSQACHVDLLALSFRIGLCCFVSSIQGARLVLYELAIARMNVTSSVHLSVLNSISSIQIMKLPIVAVLFCLFHPPWLHLIFLLGHNKCKICK
jgi:hypothetical protein